MRRRRYATLASILVYYVLNYVWYIHADRTFNADMNEDVGLFMSSYQNARSDSDRAQALRTVLLNTKRNTLSLVSSVNNAFSSALFGFMLLATTMWWTTMGAGGEKDGVAGQDPSPKDADSNKG